MLNALKQDWPVLLIYLAAGEALLSANLQYSDWQFWAILVLFVLHYAWCKNPD